MLLVKRKQFWLKLHETFFEAGWSLSNFGTTIHDFIQWIYSSNIGSYKIVFSLESIINEILEFFHLDFDDDLIH